MKAALLSQYNQIEIVDRKVPEYLQDEVLIEVRYASICGSDQHIYKGEFHPRTQLPLIPGHEFAGIASACGKKVKSISPGDKLTVDPVIACGSCPACKRGHFPACTTLKLIGIDMDGGFAEFISVPESMVWKIPPAVPLEFASLVELLSIGFHATRRAGLEKNESFAIWGAGKVGQAILHAARTMNKGKVFVVDIIRERLEIVKNTFPDVHCIDAISQNPVECILNGTNGNGVDVAFEAIGHFRQVDNQPNPVQACIRAIRGGGKVCVLGLSGHTVEILFKEMIWKEATIISSRVSHGEFSGCIESLQKGKLDPSAMITSIKNFDQINEAFQELEDHPDKHLKTLIRISQA